VQEYRQVPSAQQGNKEGQKNSVTLGNALEKYKMLKRKYISNEI
jgi:hypothetical protein